MLVEINPPTSPGVHRKRPKKVVVDARDGRVEVDEMCLWTVVEGFTADDPGMFIRSMAFFDVYSVSFAVPVRVANALQDVITRVFEEVEENSVVEPALRIVSQIAGTYSGATDFTKLIRLIWRFMPRSSAFDAAAALVSVNREALNVILSDVYMNDISSFFGSDEMCIRSGAIGLLNAIAAHPDVVPHLGDVFIIVVDAHFGTSGVLRVQSFELLESLTAAPSWLVGLLNHARFGDVFVVESAGSVRDTQLIASLRLLERILAMGVVEDEELMTKSQTISLVHAAIAQESGICRLEGLKICKRLLARRLFVDEIAAMRINEHVLGDCVSFNVWKAGMIVLALLFHVGSPSIQSYLMSGPFIRLLGQGITTLLDDCECSTVLLATTASLVVYAKGSGKDDPLEELVEHDVTTALTEFSNRVEDAQQKDLALGLISVLDSL